MGNVLWLIGIVFISYGVISLGLGNPEKRKKSQWLLKHFGQQGRDNWLFNEFIIFRMNSYDQAFNNWNLSGKPKSGGYYEKYIKEDALYDQCVAKYGKNCFKLPHFDSDGAIRGVFLGLSHLDYAGGDSGVTAPWCPWLISCRTEPNGADWMAAGYQTQFVLNGKTIDPLKMYVQEGGQFAKC